MIHKSILTTYVTQRLGGVDVYGDLVEDELEEPCYGKRCTANEHCCPGSVCVDVDGGKDSRFIWQLLISPPIEILSHNESIHSGGRPSDIKYFEDKSFPYLIVSHPATSPKSWSQVMTILSYFEKSEKEIQLLFRVGRMIRNITDKIWKVKGHGQVDLACIIRYNTPYI